ncbi:MAG: rRNA maturation RNase YbeY [bacterium]|nr:rRNA maturation RNase YbeY [bacterium]
MKKSAAKSPVPVVAGNARYRPLERSVRRALIIGLQTLKLRRTVEAFLVDDRAIRRLNRVYRKKDKATNVLSFPWPDHFVAVHSKARPLGEIYLGPDYIRRHGEDLSCMAVHGLLHLLGYDHTEKGERLRMERKERQIMKLLSARNSSLFLPVRVS